MRQVLVSLQQFDLTSVSNWLLFHAFHINVKHTQCLIFSIYWFKISPISIIQFL